MTATLSNASDPTLRTTQAALRPLLGMRYELIAPLGIPAAAARPTKGPKHAAAKKPATKRPTDAKAHDGWSVYLADDTSLRRKVVLRIATRAEGSTVDLHDRVQRARHAAKLNAHLVAHVYDAVIAGDPSMVAPPETTAVIVGEYFEGETLKDAIERNAKVDHTAILAALAHRVADAADAGVSFGSLRSDNVILTKAGPAIATLPVGTLAELGPTSLDALAAEMRSNPLTRAVRKLRRNA